MRLRKRLTAAEKAVVDLRARVSELREDISGKPINFAWQIFDFGGRKGGHYDIPLVEKIDMLMEHLGLEFEIKQEEKRIIPKAKSKAVIYKAKKLKAKFKVGE